jgi:hypothetical protein
VTATVNEPPLFEPGLKVMVRTAVISGEINGHLPLVCMAEVMGPAEGDDLWWLTVWMGQREGMPQMYKSEEILGTPSLGLTYVPVIGS